MGNQGATGLIALVVGAVLVIIGFSLWPILNGATNNLNNFFERSCNDSGSRFTRAYVGVTGEATVPGSQEYNTTTGMAGGAGGRVTQTATATTCTYAALATANAGATADLVNEYGETIATGVTVSSAVVATGVLGSTFSWVNPNAILLRFATINNLLLGVIPLVSVAAFLGISGANLYRYGRNGSGSIGGSISNSIYGLIGLIVSMVLAVPIMSAMVDANATVASGQYVVNGQFGTILSLLFGMIPIIYIAGLLTVVGLQARSSFSAAR